MTGRRFFLLFVLVFGLSVQASPPSYPLIVQIPPTFDITNIVTALGGKIIDTAPGAGTYLLRVTTVPSSWMASVLGIQWIELNEGATLPDFGEFGILPLPPNAAADWYKEQPSLMMIRLSDALPYSTGRGVVVADINSKVDVAHPALIGHLTTGYDFVADKPTGPTTLNQSSASFMDDNNPAYSHGTLCAGVIGAV